jgi:hypothetical protein
VSIRKGVIRRAIQTRYTDIDRGNYSVNSYLGLFPRVKVTSLSNQNDNMWDEAIYGIVKMMMEQQ